MPIPYELTPPNAPRKIFQVDDAISQLADFSNEYRPLFDFIENGGLDALGYNAETLAMWRRNIRPGVIWVGGRPSETDFFRMMMGGTPKDTDATDLTIEYNSAIDYNIYAQNDASGTSGTVTGGCYYGNVVNGNYTGPYAQFTIASSGYAENGTACNVNVGDQLLIYNDNKWVQVIKIDTTTAYAFIVYVVPFDENYTIQIYGGYPIIPSHVQMTSGYSDSNTIVVHTEWETTGYFKTVRPFNLQRDWETPIDLMRGYKDVIQFPIIFDTNTGAEIDSWDFKAMAGGRNDMVMAENLAFFTGEQLTNTTITTAGYTNKYTGFDGLLTTIFYGGGNIKEFDNSYGFDLDVDYTQIILQNDALKLSTEYLLMAGKRFHMTMQRRIQDALKGNAGACTFDTFKRGGAEMADIKRLGIMSWEWLGATLHTKEVGAFSDSRWIGNGYYKNMGIMLPGNGLTDSNGQIVNPVEYWTPKGRTEGNMWSEIWRDHRKLNDKADKFSGTIYHQVMMSVNGVENMFAIMPKFL